MSNFSSNEAGHQMASNQPNTAAGFQRPQKNNLAVLRPRQLRREALTAEEATKNLHPRARTRARISARTSRNPAR